MMKKVLAALFLIIVICGILIFINRYKIFQYSAERIVLSALPAYLKIESIDFDLKNNHISAKGARVANPSGFSEKPILEIEAVSCRYKFKSVNPLDGIDITELTASGPVLRIERRPDGKINFEEMKGLGSGAPELPAKPEDTSTIKKTALSRITSKKPAELLGLPGALNIRDGRVVYIDRALYDKPYIVTFDNINSAVSLKLNDDFSKILSLTGAGSGCVNRKSDESVEWNISFNPTTPKLTMSGNFKVSKVEMLPFQPYFLRYSPFIFRSGRFSGDLVFDFDNGNVGSTNTVWLEGLSFEIREGFEGSKFWQTTVPDLVKYLTSNTGAVVFDFKIKGPMQKPHFYLGPITKRALTEMTVDKITDIVKKAAKGDGTKSDLEKVQDVIDVFKGMMKKK